MKRRMGFVSVVLVAILSVTLGGCATPTPEVVEKVVTQVVKETVVVEGTPQVVEKEVTKIVEVEKVITAPPERSAASKTFTVAWVSTDVSTFDPHECGSTDCLNFMRSVYEALVGVKYGTTEIESQLAESWEVSDDGLEWTFTLRDGLTFADGSPITPEDVIYSCDRLAGMQKNPSMYLGGVYTGAEAIDDRTVTIKLEKPMGPFLSMLPRVFIVNSEVVKEHATTDDPWAETWMYDHDAGSGPYILEEWEHGVSMSVVKNPNYWDPERPKDVERHTVLFIAERATDQLLLERGEIDALGFPVVDLIPTYEANPDIVVGEHESFKGMNIMMPAFPPLDDVRVRKAFSLAFDYQAMIDGVFQGYAIQGQGPLPRQFKFHDDTLPIYTQDLEQAKALLAEAGHPGGGFELEMIVITGYTPWIGAAQIMQQSLAEIGVVLNIVEMPWTQMAARGQNPDNPLQIYVINSFPSYADADAIFFSSFHTSRQVVGWNMSFYGDDETDALMDQGRFSVDEAEREDIYKKLQWRLFDDHAAIWMLRETTISVRRSWVDNYMYDPTWHETFRPDLLVLEGKP